MNKDSDVLMFKKYIKDAGYKGFEDKPSKRKNFFKRIFPKKVQKSDLACEMMTNLMIYKVKQ